MFPPSHFPPIPIGVCFCQCFVCKSAYVAHSQRVRYVTRSVRCRVFPTVLTPMLCLEAFPSKRMCNRPLRNSRNRGGDSVWGPFFGFYFLFFSYQGLLHVVGIQRHRFDRPGPQLAGMSRNWQKKWFSTFFFGQLHSFSVFLLLNFFRCVAQETSYLHTVLGSTFVQRRTAVVLLVQLILAVPRQTPQNFQFRFCQVYQLVRLFVPYI